MAENKNLLLLKVALVSFAVVAFVVGLGLFFIPELIVKLAGSAPVDSGWLRWPGGTLTASGIGALLVLRNPKNQGIFVTTSALGTLLAGLAMVHSWINPEAGSYVWFTALNAFLLLLISALLWWGRQKALDILKSDQ
ncbi:MAG: hypothetical protein NTV31_04400 [Bacteroidia bacterium]|nr:hypothetical protein [Bacteroidia bacterium]